MKTLSGMSTGHIIIEVIALFLIIIAALYLVYSIFYLIGWFQKSESKPEDSELHSRARYKATDSLMEEIKKQLKLIKTSKIKASELRIGNYVSHKETPDWCPELNISLLKEITDEEHLFIPIPLTEEWLVLGLIMRVILTNTIID